MVTISLLIALGFAFFLLILKGKGYRDKAQNSFSQDMPAQINPKRNTSQSFDEYYQLRKASILEKTKASPASNIYSAINSSIPLQNEAISSQVDEIQKELENLRSQHNRLLESQQQRAIQEERKIEDLKKQEKRDLLAQIFEGERTEYSQSDEFEEKEFYEKLKKQKNELDIKALKLEIDEELLDQRSLILNHQFATEKELISVRKEMTERFTNLERNLQLVAQDLMTFKVYIAEKFSSFELAFLKEMNNLKELLIKLQAQFQQEIANLKLDFGQEILRVDQQILSVIDKMRVYENEIRAFGLETMKIKMDAERFSLKGQEMLVKAQLAHQQQQLQTQQLSKDLAMSLEKIALKEQGFANTVGAAKLKMDEISNQQYLALKDMAYERIGINALRDDYQKRVSLEQERFNRLNDQHRFLLREIKTAQSHGKEVAGLEHRMTMTREDLNHSQNQLGLYRQEISQIKRLSK